MKAKRKKKKCSGYNKELNKIINDYVADTGNTVVDMRLVAAWAIARKRWDQEPASKIARLAKELSTAARQDYVDNDKGEPVRRKHSWTEKQGDKQLTLWVNIEDATPHQMKACAQQRRKGILADCVQLERDVDYYNDKHNPGESIQLTFDFTEDMHEKDESTEYPSAPPDDEPSGGDGVPAG